MASTQVAQFPETAALGEASDWARQLAKDFSRVALFHLDGTAAHLLDLHGIFAPETLENRTISLIEATPLRWTLEAAAPLVAAGKAPGGTYITALFGLKAPRAYAILPFVLNDKLVALAYVDNGAEPLPLAALGRLFNHGSTPVQNAAKVKRPRDKRRKKSLAKPKSRRIQEPLAVAPQVEPVTPTAPLTQLSPIPPADFIATPPAPLNDAKITKPAKAVASRLPVFDAPLPEILNASLQPAPGQLRRLGGMLIGSFLLSVLLLTATLAATLGPTQKAGETVEIEIPRTANFSQIATLLAQRRLIRSTRALALIARLTRVDKRLHAGVYRIPTGLWAPQILQILHRGQVQTVRVTIPEGLTLQSMAELLQRHRLVNAADFVAAAHDPQLLSPYKITAASAEGFLFPETYRVVRGVSARELVGAMLRQFFSRLKKLHNAENLRPAELFERVILASILEAEVRDKKELSRVAGVFVNRLNKNMRLESCATVQYFLGHSKERLTLNDIRTPSPFNTYLHTGLPPGAITNPGAAALEAAINPETHDYLFFFARRDNSQQHYFSRSFAEHQEAHRRFGYKP